LNILDEFKGAITLSDLNRMSVKERSLLLKVVGFRNRRKKLDKMMEQSMRRK